MENEEECSSVVCNLTFDRRVMKLARNSADNIASAFVLRALLSNCRSASAEKYFRVTNLLTLGQSDPVVNNGENEEKYVQAFGLRFTHGPFI